MDDLGWTDLGYMGITYNSTPNIDKIAEEAIMFTNADSNAPNCPNPRLSVIGSIFAEVWSLNGRKSCVRYNSSTLKMTISESMDLSTQCPDATEEMFSDLRVWRAATNAPVPKDLNPNFDQVLYDTLLAEIIAEI